MSECVRETILALLVYIDTEMLVCETGPDESGKEANTTTTSVVQLLTSPPLETSHTADGNQDAISSDGLELLSLDNDAVTDVQEALSACTAIKQETLQSTLTQRRVQ